VADGKAPSTKERIIEAGRITFAKYGAKASMSRIAEAAGVSRQTLYLQFGDRIGLLQELASARFRTEPVAIAMLAAPDLPALEAFEGFCRNWIRTAILVEPSMRPYWREAEEDPELMAAVRRADKEFQNNYRKVFAKLAAAGFLRPIWTAEEATDAAYQTTMYGVFAGHLHNMRGWTADEIVERGMKVLRATFLTDEAAKRAAKIKVLHAS
jgi:AcrR family transcriptional regulator